MSRLDDLVNSASAGWQDAPGTRRSVDGRAPLHMLDERDGAARLIFESGTERRAARLPRWLAIIRFEQPAGRRARVLWLLDARTVRWSRALPPGGLYRGATGLNSEETPILWFYGGGEDIGRGSFTASGVFGAAGIVDAAEVRVTARRIRSRVRFRMAVNPQLWDLSPGPADIRPWMCPRLTITASGALQPLELDAIRTWL
jgi:hypothetical protein